MEAGVSAEVSVSGEDSVSEKPASVMDGNNDLLKNPVEFYCRQSFCMIYFTGLNR